MSRPRKSPFPKLVLRMEMFARADTPIRARKYNAARLAVMYHVIHVERRLREAEVHIAAMHEVASEGSPDVPARLKRLIDMRAAHLTFASPTEGRT